MIRRSYRRSMARLSTTTSTQTALYTNEMNQSSLSSFSSSTKPNKSSKSKTKSTSSPISSHKNKARPLSRSAESMVPFGPVGFSDDVLMLVLSMLDILSLMAVARTSQHMRRVQMIPVVWRTALQTFFHDIPRGPRLPDVFETEISRDNNTRKTKKKKKSTSRRHGIENGVVAPGTTTTTATARRNFIKHVKSIVAKGRPDNKAALAVAAESSLSTSKPSVVNPTQQTSTTQNMMKASKKSNSAAALALIASSNPLIRHQMAQNGGHMFSARLHFAGLFMRRPLPRGLSQTIPHWGVCPVCDNSLVSRFDQSRCPCVCVRTRMPLTLVVLQSRTRSRSSSKLGWQQLPFTMESNAMIESLRAVFELRVMVVGVLSTDILAQADVLIVDVTMMIETLDLTELTLISDMVERGGGVIIAGSVVHAVNRKVVQNIMNHFGADPLCGRGKRRGGSGAGPRSFQLQMLWNSSYHSSGGIKAKLETMKLKGQKGMDIDKYHRHEKEVVDVEEPGQEHEHDCKQDGQEEQQEEGDEKDNECINSVGSQVMSLTDGPFGKTCGPIVGSSVAADVFRINAHGAAAGAVALPTTNVYSIDSATRRTAGRFDNDGLTFALYFGKNEARVEIDDDNASINNVNSRRRQQQQRNGQLLVCADLDWTRDGDVGGCWAEVCNQRFMFNFCARTVADRRVKQHVENR